MTAETRETVVRERLLGTLGHGLENKSLCGWETAALPLSTQFIWVTLLLGLIVCPGTHALPHALPQLRGSPQQTVAGKGARGEGPANPPCKCTECRGILQASCSRAGAGSRGIAQEELGCQDRVGLVQKSRHLHKEQRFAQTHVSEARGKHDWDEGCTR